MQNRRASLSFLALTVLMLLQGCTEESETTLQLPQSRNELKEFLIELVTTSEREIVDIRKKQSSSNQNNQFGWDVVPKKLSVAHQGIGLVWEREVINQPLEKLEAIKGLSSAHEWFDDYCNQDIVKGWMEDFGYHVQEQLYFGGELLYDEIINKESCERHLAMTASYNCEGIDTTSSSFIEGAEYCADQSLYIDLGENIYLYENVTNDDWLGFKSSDSLGQGFHKYIEKKYHHSEKIEGEKGINDVN